MPVETAPNTLGTLRAALIERCQLDTNDPRANTASLNAIINEAISRFDMAEHRGWPWDYTDSNATGIPLLINAATPDPYPWDPSTFPFVAKVRHVLITDLAATWQFPLERMSRDEQLTNYPLDSQRGTPRTFALMGLENPAADQPGVAMYLRPRPDQPYNLTIAGHAPIPTLAADGDPDVTVAPFNDWQIDDWSDIALEYAAHLVYRGADDLSEAISAKGAFDADVLGMRRVARRTTGAGIPGRPSSDDVQL